MMFWNSMLMAMCAGYRKVGGRWSVVCVVVRGTDMNAPKMRVQQALCVRWCYVSVCSISGTHGLPPSQANWR